LIHDKAIEAASELAEEIELFCTRNEVELFILFGSQARGAPHAGSDMDIALQFAPRQEPSKLQLIHGLEMMLMPKTVDLVILTPQTDPALGAGLRNILVHESEAIDYKLLCKSIPQAIKDVEALIESVSKQI